MGTAILLEGTYHRHRLPYPQSFPPVCSILLFPRRYSHEIHRMAPPAIELSTLSTVLCITRWITFRVPSKTRRIQAFRDFLSGGESGGFLCFSSPCRARFLPFPSVIPFCHPYYPLYPHLSDSLFPVYPPDLSPRWGQFSRSVDSRLNYPHESDRINFTGG